MYPGQADFLSFIPAFRAPVFFFRPRVFVALAFIVRAFLSDVVMQHTWAFAFRHRNLPRASEARISLILNDTPSSMPGTRPSSPVL